MKLFPENHKRTKTNVPFAVPNDDGEAILIIHSVVGVERLPLIVHRKVKFLGEKYGDFEVHRGDMWTITHLFTGYNLGVHGSYEFVSTIANKLLEQPILYLPSHKMMTEHGGFSRLFDHCRELKSLHWDLGGKNS